MDGNQTEQRKSENNLGSETPRKSKPQKNYSSVQYNASRNFYRDYRKTGKTLKTPKKDSLWNWGKEQDEDFNNFKEMLTKEPCLGHYAKDKENIVTTGASKTGIGITLWQK